MAQPIQYSYNPPPNELPLYEALFTAADKQSSGYITGHSAVEFLSLSKLPVDHLKRIWTMADVPPTNMLDKPKFNVAVRLIQLSQNGKRPVDSELRLGQGEVCRAPFFEGVGGQMQQQPQQQQAQQTQQQPQMQPQQQPQQQQQMQPQQPPQQQLQPQQSQQQSQPPTALALTTDPYTMTPAEQSRYSALFPTYSQEGYVHGPAAVDLFSKSGMDRTHLKSIWSMCDDPVDNKLDLMEFCVAMHLIVCVTKKGLGMPEELPGSLRGVLERSREGQGQGQNQSQGGQLVQVNQGMQAAGQMNGQMQQQQQQTPATPASPGGMPSPSRMGYNLGVAQHGIPPPPYVQQQQQPQQQQQYSMPQMNSMGQGAMPPPMPYQNQMGGNENQSYVQPNTATETVDDAFAGMSNSPVEDVDEYSTIGGGSTVTGGMSMQKSVTPRTNNAPPPPPQQYPSSPNPKKPPPSPSRSTLTRTHSWASPKPTPKPSRKDTQEDIEFNSELEKLRLAHQKLQAEIVSLRAKANLVSEEEQEAQCEMRGLAGEIAELSLELAELKDELAERKAKLADSLVMLKTMKEKKESLEVAIKDTREIKDSIAAATEAVIEANEAMMKEHAHAVAASAKAAEAEAQLAETAAAEQEDLFSWDAALAPVPDVMPSQTHSREMSDISHNWGPENPTPVNRGMSDISHSLGHNWGADNPSVTTSIATDPTQNAEDKKVDESHSVQSAYTSLNTGLQSHDPFGGFQSDQQSVGVDSAMQPPFGGFPSDQHSVGADQQSVGANPAVQPNPYGGFQPDQQSVGGNSASQPNPYGGYSMGPAPATAMVPAPLAGGYDYGMDLMGLGPMTPMGAPIPESQPAPFNAPMPAPAPQPSAYNTPMPEVQHPEHNAPAHQAQPPAYNAPVAETHPPAYNAPEPAPVPTPMPDHVPPANGPKSPTVEEVQSLKKQALEAEQSYKQSQQLVSTLTAQVENLEAEAKKAEVNLHAAEKKKGSFTAKNKKKKAVSAAQETVNSERQKVSEARLQLAAAKREAESKQQLADELRQKSEQAEIDAATAASMQQAAAAPTSNGYDTHGGMGMMGGQNQGGYSNPFAM